MSKSRSYWVGWMYFWWIVHQFGCLVVDSTTDTTHICSLLFLSISPIFLSLLPTISTVPTSYPIQSNCYGVVPQADVIWIILASNQSTARLFFMICCLDYAVVRLSEFLVGEFINFVICYLWFYVIGLIVYRMRWWL